MAVSRGRTLQGRSPGNGPAGRDPSRPATFQRRNLHPRHRARPPELPGHAVRGQAAGQYEADRRRSEARRAGQVQRDGNSFSAAASRNAGLDQQRIRVDRGRAEQWRQFRPGADRNHIPNLQPVRPAQVAGNVRRACTPWSCTPASPTAATLSSIVATGSGPKTPRTGTPAAAFTIARARSAVTTRGPLAKTMPSRQAPCAAAKAASSGRGQSADLGSIGHGAVLR